jgi:adenylate cyclase
MAAVLAADVVGYSRLMGIDETGTLAALKSHRLEVIEPRIAEHEGRIVKLIGDGMLVEFPSVVNAVACAAEVQRGMRERNAEVPRERRIEFRIGVNVGDVIVEAEDIFGDGVNIAARLEAIAAPGGIAVSAAVRDHIGNRLGFVFEDMGEQRLRNIDRPVRVYSVGLTSPSQLDLPVSGRPEAAAKERPSIVVLPFNNMSGDPEQEYFSDGITEDIITDLSKISGLSVIARNSAFTCKGKPVDVVEVARRFNVMTVLEGSVRKSGKRVRINTQLASGKDGTHLWADRYDRDLTDIFAIQDEITQTIVSQLRVRLLPEEKKAIEQAPTESVEAYTYYLRGRQQFRSLTKPSLQLAREMFVKAAELDPNYARAYAGIADCDSFLYAWHGVEKSLEDMLEVIAKALSLDPNLAEAHASRGLVLARAGRSEEAVAAFLQAIALNPNSYEGHYFYARYLFARGDFEGAIEHYGRAAEIQPDDYRSPLLSTSAAYSLGRLDLAVKLSNMGLERAERAMALHPQNSDPVQLGATALASLGQYERARGWIERALAADPDDSNALYNCACAFAQLGEIDRAIEILERILPRLRGREDKLWFEHDSDLDPIRNHPRYQKLLDIWRSE